MPFFIYYAFLFIVGLCVGSFLNVVIYRLPFQKSIVYPNSHCPKCQQPIRFFDNIPLISFLVLRGKCRHCQSSISVRYPLVEFLTGGIFLAVALQFGISIGFLPSAIFSSALIAVSFIDIDCQIIPDLITYPLIGLGLGGAALQSLFPSFRFWPLSFLESIFGFLVGSLTLVAIIMAYYVVMKTEGMGGGDIKMMAMIGAYLGWEKTLLTLFLACIIGTLVALPLMILTGMDRSSKITFGPFLAIGALLSLFYGDFLIELYTSSMGY